jgi:beta-1,4-N-acetylglucosaminyltransferase
MSTRVIYVESFARTQTLSLTGRILYPVVDCFVVQWPALREKYPRAIYSGILV